LLLLQLLQLFMK